MDEYFADLWDRWQHDETKAVRYEHWPDAQLSKCHETVDAYVREHQDCKAIRGAWVQPIGGNGSCLLHAHSLVELPDGEWLDITPLTEQERDSGVKDRRQRANLVFLEHRGTAEQFRQFCKIGQVLWPPAIPDAIEPDFGSSEGLM
jgi:hypothetical protein